jgi:outer membrane protein assembly factor BamB
MKRRILFPLFAALLSISFAIGQVPTWTQELDEEISDYEFLREGKFLFLRAGEYVWLYDAAAGKKIYDMRIKGYDKDAVHQLVGERYLVSNGKRLQSYDAVTGKLQWDTTYVKISQDNFKNLSFIGNMTVLRYKDIHLGIDLTTGKEIWRQEIEYNSGPVDKGSWNWTALDKQNKLLVLLDGDKCGLFQFYDGKQVFAGKDYEINSDLLKKSRKWYHASADERFALFLLDKSIAVLDVSKNMEINRVPIKFDEDFEPIMETTHGCAILGKDKVYFFNDSTGSLSQEIKARVGDFRTYEIKNVNGKEIFFAGLQDGMFAIDLLEGRLLWQSKEEDKNFAGYAHRYIKVMGNNLLIAYGTNSGGTEVRLMSMDAMTGKVNYRTPAIARSKIARPAWMSALAEFTMNLDGQKNTFGYDKLGFEYTIQEYEGNLIFAFVDIAKMEHPETHDSGGDGICVIDPATGSILFKDYVRLVDYSGGGQQQNKPKQLAPLFDGKYVVLIGDENLAVYDLSVKKRLFLSKETLKGFPEDAMIVDGVLYIKFGTRKFSITLEPGKNIFDPIEMKLEDGWDEDPYGFAAYDAASGKQYWRVETKVDPGFLTPGFSMKNNYDSASKRIYFGDQENIYALQMRPDGGKFDLKIKMDDIKIGTMPFKKTYAIQEWPIGSVKADVANAYTTTYSTYHEVGGHEYDRFISEAEQADAITTYNSWFTVWGAAAKKCLRVMYFQNEIFAIGSEGIARINTVNGKVKWMQKWEYDQDNVQYMPKIIGGKLVYCVERQFTCLDMETGKLVWQAKEAKRPRFFVSPSDKYIFSIDKEVIKGYDLKN